MKWYKRNKDKLTVPIIVFLIISTLTASFAFGQSVNRDSKLGKEAFNMVKELEIQVQENTDRIRQNEAEQKVFNAVTSEQINDVQKDLDYLIESIDEIRIHLFEGN